MEIGNKRHGKKSDKETQSPVLKVFKEMIKRETNDPEKANLLKEKQENKKRRQYSGSRSKSDRDHRSCDSSSSEKNRRNVQYTVAAHEQRLKDYNQRNLNDATFLGKKKDKWWVDRVSASKKRSEDTHVSCGSCFLKRLITSEYTIMTCLGVLFLICVLLTFVVLFKAVPCATKVIKPTCKKSTLFASQALKNKIDKIQRGYDDGGDDRPLDDSISRHLSSLTALNGNDFDDGSLRELNTLGESGRSDRELNNFLDAETMKELSSERLRNFYKKLIQTDAQIRNLKKGVNYYPQNTFDEFKYLDRSKRSLRFRPRYLLKKNSNQNLGHGNSLSDINKLNNIFYPPHTVLNATNRISRKSKRFSNDTEEPMGFLVEKKQILVQYKPQNNLRKVPKCSHAPKDSKSHEKDRKHPFYKNTQRLDELLDQLLDKNLPEIMVDPFGTNALFKHRKDNPNENDKVDTKKTDIDNLNEKTKKPLVIAKNKEELSDKLFQGHDKPFELGHNRPSDNRDGPLDRTYFNVFSNRKISPGLASVTPSYDLLLSVSTIISPGRKVSKSMAIPSRTPSLLERVPNIRRLMQVEEEGEEGIGYEDLKEVLADDTEGHDEVDKGQDRQKRMEVRADYKFEDFKVQSSPSKYNPPGVHNPNWKGPMPLYPDELSSMIKQAAIENVQNFHQIINVPSNTRDISSEANFRTGFNDMEYIENYSDSKFENLAKMAQAYSDYGVLDEKKASGSNDKAMDGKSADSRVKMSIAKGKSFKNALLQRLKKNKVSEGIRFEITPTTKSRDDKLSELWQDIEKHVKITPVMLRQKPPGFCNCKYKKPIYHLPICACARKGEHKDYYPDKVSEGIRLEIRPTQKFKDDSPSELLKNLENHFKVINDNTFAITLNPEFGFYYSTRNQPTKQKQAKNEELIKYPVDVMFAFAKNGRRSLKSFEDPEKSMVNNDDANKTEIEMVVKGINGLNVQDSNDKLSWIGKETESLMVDGSHHDCQHHHGHHHHNKTNNGEIKLEQKGPINYMNLINDKDNVTDKASKNNATSEEMTNDNATGEHSNLISTLLNLNAPKNASHTALSDFFGLMSNWFSVMAGLDASSETNAHNSSVIKTISNIEIMTTTPKNKESDIEFPMYDSDMIENIGHRSRVLMSVEEVNDQTTNIADANNEISSSGINERNKETTSVNSAIDTHKDNSPTSSISTTANAITNAPNATPSNLEDKELTLDKNAEIADNRTIVKRNIPEDSNLIFWNDIYDDEYGVKMEPVDEVAVEKQDSKGANFMKKSGNWIQNKVRNIANNIRGKDKIDVNYKNNKRRILRKAMFRKEPRNLYTKYKRHAKYDEIDTEEKTDSFAELTAKMKEVCKEAAKAVQQTKNVQVRQNEKEDKMTTSLMQQLVRLMTDLVDFQVQQKTCVKLPPDLQEFLAWLTSSNEDGGEFRDQKSTNYNDGNSFDKPPDLVLDLVKEPSSEKETNTNARSECLGTLHAVQDLMQEYDMMSDEDKSKMTGIRDYLENQLQFLYKQLAAFNGNHMSDANMFEDQNPSYRFRRDLRSKYQDHKRKSNQNDRISKTYRFKRRFLKNFGKKHTRTTASIYDGFAMTEVNIFAKGDDGKESNKNGGKRDVNNVKRNLKDVYYKAVNDAKKSTTFKATLKAELEGFDHAQVVRIDD